MSRSYKKFPCWSAPSSDAGRHSYIHDAKRIANRKARRPWHWDIANGSAYKRITDSWDIRDWVYTYYTKQAVNDAIAEAIEDYKKFPSRAFYRKSCFRYYYYSK